VWESSSTSGLKKAQPYLQIFHCYLLTQKRDNQPANSHKTFIRWNSSRSISISMVHFQTSIPWAFLKSARCPYFTWLKQCQVNLSPTKFKMDTLVACGFMVGAHPGFLSRNKAEEELCGSLSLDDEDVLPFQLSSHSISVPIKDGAGLTFMPS
jgi:hypothetical protein